MSKSESESLAAYLVDRDVPCPACAYNLRGLSADRCPECRQPLVISVSLAEPPIVPFVLATIGLAACGIGSAMCFLVTVADSVVTNDFPSDEAAAMLVWSPVAIAAADVLAVCAFMSARGRRRFRTCPRPKRWRIVAACWAISLCVLAVWVTVFFERIL